MEEGGHGFECDSCKDVEAIQFRVVDRNSNGIRYRRNA